MKQKGLVIALMLSIGASGLAWAEAQKNVDARKLAQTVVLKYHNDLMSRMQRKLSDRNEKKVKEFDKMSGSQQQQFLYREDMIETRLKLKAQAKTLKKVFDQLCKKENIPTKFHFEEIIVHTPRYKKFTKGKKKDLTDSLTLIVPVHFQAHTVDKNADSDVKYNVTFEWEVNVKPDMAKRDIDGKKQKVRVGYELKKQPRLISSNTQTIDLLASEQKAVKQKARQQIIKWYANLPQTLDKGYIQQAVSPIAPIKVSDGEIKIPESKTKATLFTITNVKDVTVEIDPTPFIKHKKELYTQPKAYKKITPTFNISFDNKLNNATMTVTYKDIVIEPTSDPEKEARRNAADKFIADLTTQLSNYVIERDTDSKSMLSNMFADSDSKVEVSYLPKQGSEIINKRNADKYLKHLSGNNLTFETVEYIDSNKAAKLNAEHPELGLRYDPNLDTVMFDIIQHYDGNNYKDKTRKIVVMNKQDDNSYLIEKIIVVPNSTTTN